MVGFAVGPVDLRVPRGDWVYYVKAVPHGQSLLSPLGGEGGPASEATRATAARGVLVGRLLGLVVLLGVFGGVLHTSLLLAFLPPALMFVVGRVARRVHDRREHPMEVGVVRMPHPASWKVDPAQVVHSRVLGCGEDPLPHLEALADRAEAGEFGPTA